MAYHSKFTGAEVDSLLEQVQKGEVGEKVTVDSSLSTTSENPVMNKVITEELNKKLEGEVVGTTEPTEDFEVNAEIEAKLAELSEKVNELDKGEAYIMGDTLTFRNWADASIEGETLKL